MKFRIQIILVMLVVFWVMSSFVWGQSSSLYLAEPGPVDTADGKAVNLALQRVSYYTPTAPGLRKWKVHDLVTIIVRESSSSSSEATLETEKKSDYGAELSAFPKISGGHLVPMTFPDGNPKLDLKYKSKYEGDGEYDRKDEFVTRIQARVVDVKPNGTLAIEARKFIQTDDETVTITLSGYCRSEDVTGDNSVLSSQISEMRITKKHTGELRKSSKKGFLTKILDAIFNF